ncbi:precorrin-3B synthase [Paracoccus tegillarcae]|uniref:Precorrin-3B synthase n=1 Tax=Paracoccus tegillarcae TaxID=1529068 RepID=A0A2K9EB52_9RHOB|nr:precorrin-3B synthase [Paracoccus tegillarcae]AUH32118.1 precorrin-3B synthase [Paracoccus tegillarcae]
MSAVRGWCPGALRPMESGDGWVVRIKPPGGRLMPAQAVAIAEAARRCGNGRIELTGRANLQLRGVTPDTHADLIETLAALDLIDPDIATETRRNIIVTPFADGATDRLAMALAERLAASDLSLPAKFGFAVDTGPRPILRDVPADIRLERDPTGALILLADGMSQGQPLHDVAQTVELAAWFLQQGGMVAGRGRMAALIAAGRWPDADRPLSRTEAVPEPGLVVQGALVGLEFGQIEPDTLIAVAQAGPVRLTPWHMILIEGAAAMPALAGLILDPRDPRRRLRACAGAPSCPQAHAQTRPLARHLAALLPEGAILHVSGCAKGCGWPRPADLTLTATAQGFDMIRNGRAGDQPVRRALRPDQLPEVI